MLLFFSRLVIGGLGAFSVASTAQFLFRRIADTKFYKEVMKRVRGGGK